MGGTLRSNNNRCDRTSGMSPRLLDFVWLRLRIWITSSGSFCTASTCLSPEQAAFCPARYSDETRSTLHYLPASGSANSVLKAKILALLTNARSSLTLSCIFSCCWGSRDTEKRAPALPPLFPAGNFPFLPLKTKSPG